MLSALHMNQFSHISLPDLRTVPTIVTAHTFCASLDARVSYRWCLLIQEYFAQFKTIRRKQNLPNAFGISKEIWG